MSDTLNQSNAAYKLLGKGVYDFLPPGKKVGL
jgi:hypothetical protein